MRTRKNIAKDKFNKRNLKNGLAFAYRVGDLVEGGIGKAIEKSPHLEAPLLEPGSELGEGKWYRKHIPGGISGDGSEYHIYLRRGKSKHLCVFFSGGGVAWNEFTAAHPVTGGAVVAGEPNYYWNNLRPFTQIMNIHVGITEVGSAYNPFRDYNFVIITYSTGDFHVGNNVFAFEDEEGGSQVVHFHGYHNFLEAMKAAKEYFPDPDKLLIAGDSAGAFAVPALSDDVLTRFYPDCRDVTLFSDSGQLLYSHWKRTARDIWRAKEEIWKPLHTQNITLDWYEAFYKKYGNKVRYLYASSTHDYLLSAYYNDVVNKKFTSDSEVQQAYYEQLKEMIRRYKEMIPESGVYINEVRNPMHKTGMHGGTQHTMVRQLSFYMKNWDGNSMATWLGDAVDGKVYDVGLKLLEK